MVALSEKERAHTSVHAEFARIQAMVAAYTSATSPEAQQAACQAIVDTKPQIAVRSNWHQPGEAEHESEYRILLSAGAPTIQIIGDIEGSEPYTARLGYQDWFTRWEECELSEEEEEQLLIYARCFDFTK